MVPTSPLTQCTAGTSKVRSSVVALGTLVLLGLSSALRLSLLMQVQREPPRLREHRGARGEGDHHGHVAAPTSRPPLPLDSLPAIAMGSFTETRCTGTPVSDGALTSPRHHHLLIFSFPTRGTCCSPSGAGVHMGIDPQERSGGATSPAWWSPHLVGEVDVPSPRRVLTCSRNRGDPAGCLGPPHAPSCPPGSC